MQEKSWKDIWNKRKLHDFDMKVLGGGGMSLRCFVL